jgi:hypothetical protein
VVLLSVDRIGPTPTSIQGLVAQGSLARRLLLSPDMKTNELPTINTISLDAVTGGTTSSQTNLMLMQMQMQQAQAAATQNNSSSNNLLPVVAALALSRRF